MELKKQTYFVAGTYGVGKTTLCNTLSEILQIPHYSASEVISSKNHELYGRNKYVKDKYKNQEILSEAIRDIMKNKSKIILSGHFCIFNSLDKVELLPTGVFEKLYIDKIILLEAGIEDIINNLNSRDKKNYELDNLLSLREAEKRQAVKIAQILSVSLYCHQMNFNNIDLQKTCDFINRGV